MGFAVYDFRTDIRNILVTPQIRSRFLKMKVGQVNRGHTHDIGHEIFLILQGQAEFEIDGEKETLGPGQLCVALIDENHIVRNVGDDEVIMYLSVTPHIQPTHTSWTEDGERRPHHCNTAEAYDVDFDATVPPEDLLARHLEATEVMAASMEQAAKVQREQAEEMRKALASGDKEAIRKVRDTMWDALSPMYLQSFDLGDVWNDFTYRLAADGIQ